MRFFLFTVHILFFIHITSAQEFSKAIEDNSFFIEEAYNQEEGVIQHISTGYYNYATKDFEYTFTEEIPIPTQTHQFSFTLPYLSLGNGASGIGDIAFNYRYQLWNGNNWAWIAPRISFILPTGSSPKALGDGVVGGQINIPISKRWTNEFVSHWNAGITFLPNKKETFGVTAYKKTLVSYFIGGSGIYLMSENLNFMFELFYNNDASINTTGNISRNGNFILNPGLRFAINIGELQIVPGIALPLQITSASTDAGIFGYLSFEHPY